MLAEARCCGFKVHSLCMVRAAEQGPWGYPASWYNHQEYNIVQHSGSIKPLSELGIREKAYELTEKFQDCPILIQLCLEEIIRNGSYLEEPQQWYTQSQKL